MSHEEDRAKGTVDEFKGKGKQAWGAVTDDKSTEASGKGDEAKGKARQKLADAKEWVEEKTGKKDDDA